MNWVIWGAWQSLVILCASLFALSLAYSFVVPDQPTVQRQAVNPTPAPSPINPHVNTQPPCEEHTDPRPHCQEQERQAQLSRDAKALQKIMTTLEIAGAAVICESDFEAKKVNEILGTLPERVSITALSLNNKGSMCVAVGQ